jgi:uncharacterized coiled-coil DUF342 family protein
MMYKVLKEKRMVLKELRYQKRGIVGELRAKRAIKKEIDQRMAALRREIKDIKGNGHDF